MFADVGIPMIGPVIFLGWFTILPVVAVETIFAIRMLQWRLGFALRWCFLPTHFPCFWDFP